jgi:hypothetical protein
MSIGMAHDRNGVSAFLLDDRGNVGGVVMQREGGHRPRARSHTARLRPQLVE